MFALYPPWNEPTPATCSKTYPLEAASVEELGVAGTVTCPPKLDCPVPETVKTPVRETSVPSSVIVESVNCPLPSSHFKTLLFYKFE